MEKMRMSLKTICLMVFGLFALTNCNDDATRQPKPKPERNYSTAGTTGNEEYYRNDKQPIDYNSTASTNSSRGEYDGNRKRFQDDYDSTTGSTNTTETTMSTNSTNTTYNTHSTEGTSATNSTRSTYNTRSTDAGGSTSTTRTTKNTRSTGSGL